MTDRVDAHLSLDWTHCEHAPAVVFRRVLKTLGRRYGVRCKGITWGTAPATIGTDRSMSASGTHEMADSFTGGSRAGAGSAACEGSDSIKTGASEGL